MSNTPLTNWERVQGISRRPLTTEERIKRFHDMFPDTAEKDEQAMYGETKQDREYNKHLFDFVHPKDKSNERIPGKDKTVHHMTTADANKMILEGSPYVV